MREIKINVKIFYIPWSPVIVPSNSLLVWEHEDIKTQEEVKAKPRLLVLLLLHCIPYCVCWKYLLTCSIWYWNYMRGIGDKDRVQLLWELCFPFGFGCRVILLGYVFGFHKQFWYLVLLLTACTAWINMMVKPQKTSSTHSRSLKLKAGHFSKNGKAFSMCQVSQFSVQSVSWGFTG